MASQDRFQTLAITWAAVLSSVLVLGASPVRAQSSFASYTFLVGAGFLCDTGDSSACPAVANSVNGDSYEISGAGTLTPQGNSVTAAGTFTHKSNEGVVLETGIWIASGLVSFDSYGLAPGALTLRGRAFGPPQFGPMRSRMFRGPMPAGGLAVLRIRLLPVWGLSKSATLQVNCALGKVPDEHPTEGIRLSFERGAPFEQEVSGRTMFLVTRPEPKPAEKSSAPKPSAPDSPGVESEPNTTPPENPR